MCPMPLEYSRHLSSAGGVYIKETNTVRYVKAVATTACNIEVQILLLMFTR